MTGTLDYPFTLEMASAKIKSFIALDPAFGQAFAITFNQMLIGCLSIQSFQHDHIFEIGYHLGKKWWGHGYVTEAVTALIPWAFDQWGQAIIIERPLNKTGDFGIIL